MAFQDFYCAVGITFTLVKAGVRVSHAVVRARVALLQLTSSANAGGGVALSWQGVERYCLTGLKVQGVTLSLGPSQQIFGVLQSLAEAPGIIGRHAVFCRGVVLSPVHLRLAPLADS